jgi:hypothetical protein
MAEPDVFERRLRAALVRHTDDGPTDFDALGFARLVAAKEPRRRGIAVVLGWRRVVVPRVAWVLLLLAALVAVMAGTLAVGSQLQRRLPAVVPPVLPAFACPPGSTPDEPGPAGQERPLAGAASGAPIAFDRAAGRFVLQTSSPRATWTFDVCSNTWTPTQSGSGPDTDFTLVYDPGTDLTIGVDAGDDPAGPVAHAWTYDLDANTWTRRGPAPDHVARLWYDAASMQVVAWAPRSDVEPGTIWTYDVASDTWAAVGALEVLGGFGWNHPGDLLAYDASVDRLVATVTLGERIRTRLFDLDTGRVVDAKAVAPWAGRCGFMVQLYCYDQPAGQAIAYDERSQRVVVLIGGRVFAYDADADRWDTLSGDLGAGAPAREASSMVHDPVNGRLVVFAGGLDFPFDSVLAFDAATRAWTVLLEASDVPRAPSSP